MCVKQTVCKAHLLGGKYQEVNMISFFSFGRGGADPII